MYIVKRKHPNKESKHDLTIGTRRFRTGDKVSEDNIAKSLGSEAQAAAWIPVAIKRGWIDKDGGKKAVKKEDKTNAPKKD